MPANGSGTMWRVAALLWLCGWATPATAQRVDPEGGDTGAWQAPELRAADDDAEADAEPGREEAGAEDEGSIGSDHHSVVGRFGVGFFGVLAVTTGPVDLATGRLSTVPAPSLGVRHWLGDRVGVEVALGLGFASANVEEDGDGRNLGRTFGIVLHGGLPLTLYHARHYAFVVIPETNLGLAGGSARSTGGDDSFFGVLWDLGVRLGAEIHFGFIGIPFLSLQASVGVRMRVTHGRETLCVEATECDTTTENKATNVALGTSVEGDPWDIFTGAITAIYYF